MTRILLEITSIREETFDAKTFFLAPLYNKSIQYKAGQFLTFLFRQNGHEHRLSYSFSSAPGIDAQVSITIRREPNGLFSRLILEKFKVNDVLEALPPAGLFTISVMPASAPRDIFFIAGGSGITPIFSLLKYLLINEPQSHIILIYSNHDETRAIFYRRLQEFNAIYPEQLSIQFLFSNHRDVLRSRLGSTSLGLLLASELRFSKQSALLYTCGPYGLMQTAEIVALSNGFHRENIRKEIFTSENAGTGPKKYYDQTDRYINITKDGVSHRLLVPYRKTILEAALAEGIALDYSCRSGRCSACKARLLSGKVWMHYNEVLTPADEKEGWILTCTGHPITEDVSLTAGPPGLPAP